MSSRCLEAGLLALAAGCAAAAPLRVCADRDAPAFEAAIAEVLAQALQRPLTLLQAPWRHGFVLPAGDGARTPVGDALVQRGALDHVRGYPVAAQPLPHLLQELQAGTLDAALLWGPQAAAAGPGFVLTPLAGIDDVAIAVGVRRGDGALLAELQRALDERRPALDALLAAAGVPRTDR